MSKRIKQATVFEETINRSRFITHLMPIENEQDANKLIKRFSIAAASHNCWAYIAGQIKRFNDDGEPSGTAGRPMLSILETQQLNYTLALSTRWYGGIKLGTGGLIRAYSNGVKQCIDKAEIVNYVPLLTLHGFCPYRVLEQLKAKLLTLEVLILSEEFSAEGASIVIKAPKISVDKCQVILQDLSNGEFSFTAVCE